MSPERDTRRSCPETRAEVARLDGRIDGLHLLLIEREKQIKSALDAVKADRIPERVGEIEEKVAGVAGRSIGIAVIVALLLSVASIVATFWK